MKKEDLRPIEFTQRYSAILGMGEGRTTKDPTTHKGWFHYYEKKISDNGEETVYVMVETEDGKMKQLESGDFRFTDR